MLKELDDEDWAEVFGQGSSMSPILPDTPPGDSTNQKTFGREDVVLIRGMEAGENDGRAWIVWGQLKDGRWFVAVGGCDYTGWDCQAANGGCVASTETDIIRYGMTDDERHRFGLVLEDSTLPRRTESVAWS